MTFIVVPHGGRDMNTRSFEISYRRLRIAGAAIALGLVVWLFSVGSWLVVARQAARVPGLEQQVADLEAQAAQVDELASTLRQIEGQYTRVRQLLGLDRASDEARIWLPAIGEATARQNRDDADAALPSSWPLTQRGFVTREHLGGIPGQHPGIDIAIAEGSYVRAAGGGRVVEAGEDEIYGKFIRIQHDEGYETVYGHASELFVEPGATVIRNQVIALSGDTGMSTAPHLHFEVWKDGELVDPRELVEAP